MSVVAVEHDALPGRHVERRHPLRFEKKAPNEPRQEVNRRLEEVSIQVIGGGELRIRRGRAQRRTKARAEPASLGQLETNFLLVGELVVNAFYGRLERLPAVGVDLPDLRLAAPPPGGRRLDEEARPVPVEHGPYRRFLHPRLLGENPDGELPECQGCSQGAVGGVHPNHHRRFVRHVTRES